MLRFAQHDSLSHGTNFWDTALYSVSNPHFPLRRYLMRTFSHRFEVAFLAQIRNVAPNVIVICMFVAVSTS
jgi:hypothetical protein